MTVVAPHILIVLLVLIALASALGVALALSSTIGVLGEIRSRGIPRGILYAALHRRQEAPTARTWAAARDEWIAGPRAEPMSTDVLFMHADDRASLHYGYSTATLVESALLHILYCGRVLVPANFLLANVHLEPLFRARGRGVGASDIARMIEAGDVVPVLFADFESIGEYARAALKRAILLPPDVERQWLERAELLSDCPFLRPSRATYARYRQSLEDFAQWAETRESRWRTEGPRLSEELASVLEIRDEVTRSEVYHMIELDPSEHDRWTMRSLADTAYYTAIAESFGISASVPGPSIIPMLHYLSSSGIRGACPTVAPLREKFVTSIPDYTSASAADLLDVIRENPLRMEWLDVYRRRVLGSEWGTHAADDRATLKRFALALADVFRDAASSAAGGLVPSGREIAIETGSYRLGENRVLVTGVRLSKHTRSTSPAIAAVLFFVLFHPSGEQREDAMGLNDLTAHDAGIPMIANVHHVAPHGPAEV